MPVLWLKPYSSTGTGVLSGFAGDREGAFLQMDWSPEDVMEKFRVVAELAGVTLAEDDIRIEVLPAPHKPPSRLPAGTMAVYVFSLGSEFLKIGKAGPRSQARYTSQHYNPRSAASTLALSLLTDPDGPARGQADEATIGGWIRANVDRVNFIIKDSLGIHVLTLLESFLQCRLRPRYEGFKSQRS